VTVHFVHCCLRAISITSPLSQQSVSNRLSVQTSEKPKSQKKKTVKVPHLATASVNMIRRGRDLLRFCRSRQEVRTLSFSSPDSNYKVLVEQEGGFQGTRSRVAIPYNYGQPSSSESMLPKPLRHYFQWSNDEEESSGYAFSTPISSVQAGFV